MKEVPTTTQIWTRTGKAINPYDPKEVERLDFEDFGGSLAFQCRFTGQTSTFYSVAEHSVRCYWFWRPYDHKLYLKWGRGWTNTLYRACLLHDAGESIWSDFPRPIKQNQHMDEYRGYEHAFGDALVRHFCGEVNDRHVALIKLADVSIAAAEIKQLMPPGMAESKKEYLKPLFVNVWLNSEPIEIMEAIMDGFIAPCSRTAGDNLGWDYDRAYSIFRSEYLKLFDAQEE